MRPSAPARLLRLIPDDDLARAVSSLSVEEQRGLYARWLRAKVRERATQGSDLITVPAASVERIASLLEAMPTSG